MGVPSFFRWLQERFPKCIVDCVERAGRGKDDDGQDSSAPNPNGEFDVLYVDMNGIIHPACHPEGMPAPESEDAMMEAIGALLDRIIDIVRPRRLIHLAIDGVAPRAKMNQQRGRRYKAAKEAADIVEIRHLVAERWASRGLVPPPSPQSWDSNVITPGTVFMDKVLMAVHRYVAARLASDPGWNDVAVIVSGADVPGEGEHKALEFLRRQRAEPGYDATTRHCICGMDADLILLGLSTHEADFAVLRDAILPRKKHVVGPRGPPQQLLKVAVLREYLVATLSPRVEISWPFHPERAVDDFVLMCILAGNDFLPALPSLDIKQGAIDTLITTYHNVLPQLQGHLCEGAMVDVPGLLRFMKELSHFENEALAAMCRKRQRDMEQEPQPSTHTDGVNFSADVAAELKSREEQTWRHSLVSDTVRLGEPGCHERYYRMKPGLAGDTRSIEACARQMCIAYLEGIKWTMGYYYDTVPSWHWFYPFHYAPFASDFQAAAAELTAKASFDNRGSPWPPLAQLMAVLPSQSAHCLPVPHQELMTSSVLASMYPREFRQDLNGKQWAWQAVAVLPFIDQTILLKEIASVEAALSAEERRRNITGTDILFVKPTHRVAGVVTKPLQEPVPISADTGVAGTARPITRTMPFQGVVCTAYQLPRWRHHVAKLLPGAKLPTPVLTNRDLGELQRVIGSGRRRLRLNTKGGKTVSRTKTDANVDEAQDWGSWSGAACTPAPASQATTAAAGDAGTSANGSVGTSKRASKRPGSTLPAAAVRKARYR